MAMKFIPRNSDLEAARKWIAAKEGVPIESWRDGNMMSFADGDEMDASLFHVSRTGWKEGDAIVYVGYDPDDENVLLICFERGGEMMLLSQEEEDDLKHRMQWRK